MSNDSQYLQSVLHGDIPLTAKWAWRSSIGRHTPCA